MLFGCKNSALVKLKSVMGIKKIHFFVLPNEKSITFANTSESIIIKK